VLLVLEGKRNLWVFLPYFSLSILAPLLKSQNPKLSILSSLSSLPCKGVASAASGAGAHNKPNCRHALHVDSTAQTLQLKNCQYLCRERDKWVCIKQGPHSAKQRFDEITSKASKGIDKAGHAVVILSDNFSKDFKML